MGSQPTGSLLVMRDAQHDNGADITETGIRNHISIVIELCIEISTFC